MTKDPLCSNCSSPNPKGASRCQACGQTLLPNPNGPSARVSVVLQRVLGGEIFAALPGGLGKRFTSSREEESAEQAVVAIEAPPRTETPDEPVEPEIEDHSDVIAAAIDRIRVKSREEGQGFKPYVRSRIRRDPKEGTTEEVKKQLDRAVSLFRERRFQEAVEPLLKAIARDDEDRRSWILLAEAYMRAGRPYKAAVGYLRTLELAPKDEQAWLGLGRVLRAIGDLPAAGSVLERATTIHPEHADTWAERGFVHEGLKTYPDAIRAFDRVLALRPENRAVQAKRAELATLASSAATQAAASSAPKLETRSHTTAAEDAVEQDILEEMDEVLGREGDEDRDTKVREEDALQALGPDRQRRPSRIRTFVDGLDETLEGGIPWGHVVLVEGAPGTMKSSLAFSVLLHNAAREGLHCIYLSLEERASSLLKQMGSLGLKLEVSKGSLVVLDPKAASDLLGEKPDWIESLEEGVRAIKAQRGLDLIVIDSLEALEVLAKFKDRRREMYRLFEWLRDLGVTSLVITERPDWVIAGHVLQGRWDEDFLADGVVHLRMHMVSDLDAQRRMRVVKMRGTKHETGYLAMVLDDGRFRVMRAISP